MIRILALFLAFGMTQILHAQAPHRLRPPTTLQPGTSLHISLSGVPVEDGHRVESQSYTVGSDGSVTLPYIGQITIGGLSMSQAERVIERAYVAQEIYRFPTITIQRRLFKSDTKPPFQNLDAPGPGYREHRKPAHVALSE